jgi:hypothetical protein
MLPVVVGVKHPMYKSELINNSLKVCHQWQPLCQSASTPMKSRLDSRATNLGTLFDY